ncbi:MAG: hypothetical protein LBU34_01085 [Planctomycetaceae bacterium]|nr:hypothetical protein [Planctomycetaceae bacterium]
MCITGGYVTFHRQKFASALDDLSYALRTGFANQFKPYCKMLNPLANYSLSTINYQLIFRPVRDEMLVENNVKNNPCPVGTQYW